MDRLDFRIPEFVRIAWTSAQAERVWAPIINDCSNFFISLEKRNRTAIVSVKPEDMIGHGYIPLDRVNVNSTYQSGSQPFKVNKPWQYRCAVGLNAEGLASAYINRDWEAVGRFLGYPECCIQFFMKYWVEEQWFDTTYPMGRGELLSPANNILLRWVGIRLISHLPCSFHCLNTMTIGRKNIELARELGYNKEIDAIIEMLSWPVEWTSLHGIAIITTPVFKIITASDALPVKATIRLEGTKYPKETGSGLVFPFRRPAQENGFSNHEDMDKAHEKIIDAVSALKPKSIIDLGSGNGLLLNKMAQIFNAYVYGVDNDKSKNPNACLNIYNYEFGGKAFDLALVAEQRVNENPEGWKKLHEKIRQNVKHLCMYNYTTGMVSIYEHDLSNISK